MSEEGDSRPARGEPRRILVRGVNWLGDAVMTTPALQRLRERFPVSHISLLTPVKLAGLWTDHPALSDVVSFAPHDGPWQVAGRLRAGRYDLAVALPNSHRSAMELWLAGIPRRVGLTRLWRSWMLTDPVPPFAGVVQMRKPSAAAVRRRVASGVPATRPPPTAHQIHHYLHLTAALGANPAPLPPRLEVRGDEVEAARSRFGLTGGRWLALNPGAEYGPAKRWPAERFVQAAVAIQRQAACHWLVLGGPADVALATRIAEQVNAQAEAAREAPIAVTVAGRTSLRELCALLRSCKALLTNDTGPMHVGAALGTPVVALFGSTSPELTGPGLMGDSRHRVLREPVVCAPCFLRHCPIDFRCLARLDTAKVVEAVLSFL